ncbi:transglycosylase domain-containing protein [Clostridium sp. OS1-26]|uniref:transglycosylase domain-containing protein n=1 Tax=Clostridium sp. OS1-26 TaxID=3070681 RepID=UPI0027E135FD|nr:transglycosylase domain-containing protein [Clostridium sp. OS1-26]WML37048.1 transglycosylase domain-containing protein [Clostridium sp. OS1-26]
MRNDNYGNINKQKNKKRVKKPKKKKPISKALLILTWIILLITVFSFSKIKGVFSLYMDASTKVKSISAATFNSRGTVYIYDNKKEVIDKLYDSKDVEYVNYGQIPQAVMQSFVAIEDKDFFNHHGVSLKAITRAAYSMVKNKGEITQGGSTITQQLAKNVFLTQQQSMKRKVEEMFIALKLERMYTKEQILEFYVNNIYFANGAYGIQAASKKYFSKEVKELDLSQIAFLAAIPNNPEYYDPLKNEGNTIQRRNLILSKMQECNFITQGQYDEAVNEKIALNPEKTYTKQSYISSYAVDCAAKALMEQKGFEFRNNFKNDNDRETYNKSYSDLYTECVNEIYRNGYKIYTSIDMEKQKLLQQSIDNKLSDFTKQQNGIYLLQGSAVTIDNKTGTVVAIVGGRTSDKKDYLNRAFQSFRQPGSTLKPLVVYTPSFEKGFSPSSVIDDKYTEGGPHNSGDAYYGNVTLSYAVQLSLNTVANQIFKQITPEYGISFLKSMNFSKIVKKDYTLSTALGGLTNGASTLEMASGYSTLARTGQYINPTCIQEIVDSSGNKIYKNSYKTKEVYTKQASTWMTDILKGSIENPWGTAHKLKLSNMTAAGKTGTTDNSKDGWFCGYTPYYTTAVWVGYDNPKELDNLYGATYPGGIWKDYMDKIHQGLDNIDFERPNGVQEYNDDALNNVPVDSETQTNEQGSAQDAVKKYESCKLDTLEDIKLAEQLENGATTSVQQLKDLNAREQLLRKILNRKAVVTQRKIELQQGGKQTDDSTNNGTNNGVNNSATPPSNTDTPNGDTNNNNNDGSANGGQKTSTNKNSKQN